MWKSMIIFAIAAMVSSVPQGYNYHHPSPANNIFTAETNTNTNYLTSSGTGSSTIGAYDKTITAPSFISGIDQNVGKNYVQGSLQHNYQQESSSLHNYQQQVTKPIITKHFYIHAAPEEVVHEGKKEVINIGQPRIHYKVVFIKAPAQTASAANLALKQASVEEKTVIYVLNQQSDISDIQTSIQPAPVTANKPEVFFIKYKTTEEALHAQKQIQAQYDSLGGTSEVSDEGLAPVSSVIGSLGVHSQDKLISAGSLPSASGVQIMETYLPAN